MTVKTLAETHLSDGSLLMLTSCLTIQRMFGNGYTVMHASPIDFDPPTITKYKSKNDAQNAYADYIKRDVLEID